MEKTNVSINENNFIVMFVDSNLNHWVSRQDVAKHFKIALQSIAYFCKKFDSNDIKIIKACEYGYMFLGGPHKTILSFHAVMKIAEKWKIKEDNPLLMTIKSMYPNEPSTKNLLTIKEIPQNDEILCTIMKIAKNWGIKEDDPLLMAIKSMYTNEPSTKNLTANREIPQDVIDIKEKNNNDNDIQEENRVIIEINENNFEDYCVDTLSNIIEAYNKLKEENKKFKAEFSKYQILIINTKKEFDSVIENFDK